MKRNRIPIATAPLERGEVVYVYSPAPGMAGRIWTGWAVDATTINLAVRPGTSGAGVFVLRNDRYELAGLVIARTDVPPRELSRTTMEQGGNRVNIIVQEAGGTITHVAPAAAIEELLKKAGAGK